MHPLIFHLLDEARKFLFQVHEYAFPVPLWVALDLINPPCVCYATLIMCSIKRDFTSDRPITELLTDITEVQCSNGKLYISPIFDCYNGEIVALEMRDNMKKELCIDTVKQLKQRYGNLEGVLLHSDRGSQYTSDAFRSILSTYGMKQSLSGTGKCYDNARMESFFATLKKEKLYRIPTYAMTKEQVKTVVFRYIFAYYNTIRITSFNPGGLPPAKYRERYIESAA